MILPIPGVEHGAAGPARMWRLGFRAVAPHRLEGRRGAASPSGPWHRACQRSTVHRLVITGVIRAQALPRADACPTPCPHLPLPTTPDVMAPAGAAIVEARQSPTTPAAKLARRAGRLALPGDGALRSVSATAVMAGWPLTPVPRLPSAQAWSAPDSPSPHERMISSWPPTCRRMLSSETLA
jgi:hypothetical protein